MYLAPHGRVDTPFNQNWWSTILVTSHQGVISRARPFFLILKMLTAVLELWGPEV